MISRVLKHRRRVRSGLLGISLFLFALLLAAVEIGFINTVAGNGVRGFSGDAGPATDAALNTPFGVAVDGENNVFIADTVNSRIRRVDASTGDISTVAGTGAWGFSGDGGPATSASMTFPFRPAVDSDGNLFFADRDNHRVRRVDAQTGDITTVAGTGAWGFFGDGGPANMAKLASPQAVAVDTEGNFFIADSSNFRIRRVDAQTGDITTVAGNGTWGFSGDGGPATDARLATPQSVAVDSEGNLFIADWINRRVRRVDAQTGDITTVAGNGAWGFSGDGGPATDASFTAPSDVAVDAQGNLFIADTWNNRIRRVDASSGVITTVAGNGLSGFAGDDGPATNARLNLPSAVAVDAQGNLFIADTWNNRIRFVQLADANTQNPLNQPPAADAGPDQTVECASHNGSTVTLDGSASSDPDGDTLSFAWTDSNGNLVGTSAVVGVTLALGSHTFTLTVDDGNGGTASDTVTVTIQDTTPPALSLALSPGVLWPANHKLVEVTANIVASDACDPSPTVTLIWITSNEPDNGQGDGDTENDIQGAAVGSDDRSFYLRAERQGTGLGRLYTATYRATDASGNLREATAQVLVPFSQGNGGAKKSKNRRYRR